jgi:hypothetical protein
MLRQRLIRLRDNDIKASFPDTSEDKGLLGPRMLDEFLSKRPKSRGEWFRRIPAELRTKVDVRQVGHYLDQVLAMIAETDNGSGPRS